MSDQPKHEAVKSRNEPFAEKTSTSIWYETPAEDNPYIAQAAYCYGYSIVELMAKRSYTDVIYLLFRGELPSSDQAELLQHLMIALINPGPRHPATRAAMNAGIGKTDPLHILPISTAVYAGDYAGAKEVENAMHFFSNFCGKNIEEFYSSIDENNVPAGFGIRQGGIEIMAVQLAEHLQQLPGAGPALQWGDAFAKHLFSTGKSWLFTGVAAAALTDLGFSPRAGSCVFQLLGAPGLIAHGLEMAGKPILAMPFVSDENYVIESKPGE